MGFIGIVCVYAMRINLSVAIIAMVNSTNTDSSETDDQGTCPYPDDYNSTLVDSVKEGFLVNEK